MNIIGKAIAAAALLLLPASIAQAQEDPWSRVINMETAGNWGLNPERPRPQLVDTQHPSFAQALRVRGRNGTNPWDATASTPTGGDIAQGDTIMVMLFARAEQPAEGGTRLPLRIQLTGAPYTGALDASFNLTTDWHAYCASAVASQDFREEVSALQLHLATGQSVIDLGPVFVFNFGQNYDQANLPRCPN